MRHGIALGHMSRNPGSVARNCRATARRTNLWPAPSPSTRHSHDRARWFPCTHDMPRSRGPLRPPPRPRRVRQPVETRPALHPPRLVRPLAALLAQARLDVPTATRSVQLGVARATRPADVRRRRAPACGALAPRPLLAPQGLPVPSFTRPTTEAPARLDTVAVPAPLRQVRQELGRIGQRSSRRPRPVQTAARPQLAITPSALDVERRQQPGPPLAPLGTRRTVRRSDQVDHGFCAVAK